MFRVRCFAVASASLLLFATQALTAQYSFINIADMRGPFEDFDFFVSRAVSDTGTVAFIGEQGGVDGTYLGSGGPVQVIAPNLSPPPPAGLSQLGDWALNTSGAAAGLFDDCCNPRHQKIQLYEASGTRTIAEVMGGATFDASFSFPAINNSGAVAFGTRVFDSNITPSQQAGLIRWVNGSSTTLADFADGFRSVHGVALNEQNDVAFLGAKDLQGASVYRTDGTTLTPIAGPYATIGPTAINDSGAVAFWSRLDGGGEGVFVGDGGPLATVAIADPTTPFYDFETDIDINNQGTVAFTAQLWDGSFGIFTGPDPVNDKVAQIGDYIFGQQVRGLGRPRLNNRGDIAFWFEVRDPRDPSGYWSGIALAVKQASLPGDYNQNGTVDAADYVVWRNGLGTAYTQADYDTWRAQFGQTAGSGAALPSAEPLSTAVPEPAALILTILVAIGRSLCRRRSA